MTLSHLQINPRTIDFLDLAGHYIAQKLHTNLKNSMSANTQNASTKKNNDTIPGADYNHDQEAKCPSLQVSIETEEKSAFFQINPPEADEQTSDAESNRTASSVPSAPKSQQDWGTAMKCPWLVPHISEYQKHAWHISSLGMSSQKVKDEWGFHSTSVSRSHSPSNRKIE